MGSRSRKPNNQIPAEEELCHRLGSSGIGRGLIDRYTTPCVSGMRGSAKPNHIAGNTGLVWQTLERGTRDDRYSIHQADRHSSVNFEHRPRTSRSIPVAGNLKLAYLTIWW